ncbi:MAG TPA: SMC family ATPase [Actinomycetaceae bacterium]|nr:SMC family ATPase [Actinomycetaceae bacterium]
MRIHYLALQAIGPFAQRYEIDFDELSASGLFLLEGPTGAGKSTIIDAIVYALYNRLASERASNQRLHSNHADPSTTPRIELVFSTSTATYRVHRVPKHERPKRRGEGTTSENAKAWLWQLTHWDPAAHSAAPDSAPEAFGQPLAATPQEVATELSRVLPLSAQQFTQTVVLPQGQFATFLQAKPEDRRAVLQEVFGTQIYVAVQDELADRARAARRELDAVRGAVGEAVRGFLTAAEVEEAGAEHELLTRAEAELDAATLTEASERVVARARAAHEAALARKEDAAAAEEEATSALTAAQELDRLLERRRGLIAERHDLEQQAAAMALQEERVRAAERAAALAASMGRSRRAAEDADAAAELLAQLRAEVSAAADGQELAAHEDAAELDGLARECHRLLGGLEELLEVEAGLETRRSELAAQGAAITQAHDALTALRERREARPQARAELVSRQATAQRAAAAAVSAEATREAARGVHAAAEAAVAATGELTEATRRAQELGASAGAAHGEAGRLRQAWVAGLAGTLAADLAEGEACAVCGSTSHPAPAAPPEEAVTLEAVEQAEAEAHRLSAELADAAAARDVLAERRRTYEEQSGGVGVPEAAERLAQAEAAVAAAEQAAAEAAELAEELTEFDDASARLSEEAAQSERDLAQARVAAQAARDRLAEDTAAINAQLAGADSLSERSEALRRRSQWCERLATALRAVATHKTAAAQAAADLDAELTAAGFASVAEVDAATMPREELSAATDAVADYHRQRQRVADGLAEPAVASLTGTEDPAVAAHAQAATEARSALLAAADDATTAGGVLSRAQRAREELLGRLATLDEKSTSARAVLRMASIAAGAEGNHHATTLATYVLLRRFEDVVAAANHRLDAMSDGRYRLARIDEREGGQRSLRAGLGLEVRDNFTDTARDPHTLSGGETFYVSLCLALGLADIVTSEAGGVSLETLFIDEGFGSLDPDTLDAVLAELSGLQAGGRSVGIVSHVSELKSRIAERIEVRRLSNGASGLTVCA